MTYVHFLATRADRECSSKSGRADRVATGGSTWWRSFSMNVANLMAGPSPEPRFGVVRRWRRWWRPRRHLSGGSHHRGTRGCLPLVCWTVDDLRRHWPRFWAGLRLPGRAQRL